MRKDPSPSMTLIRFSKKEEFGDDSLQDQCWQPLWKRETEMHAAHPEKEQEDKERR